MNTIGLIGLGVMGQNYALRLNDLHEKVAVWNRNFEKTKEFIGANPSLQGYESLEDFVKSLDPKSQKIILLVKAGEPVDQAIQSLLPLLNKEAILMDFGNSHYKDTARRSQFCAQKGIHFLGVGISGGEEGARKGPALMIGGSLEAWQEMEPIFKKTAAKAHDLWPCCDYMGKEGAGHFVKMIHNGIEYADMQIISEIYHILHKGMNLTNIEIADIFESFQKTELNSYLIEITAKILRFENGELLNKILDVASQKGTGKWSVEAALELGYPATLIAESVFARHLSSLKKEREEYSQIFPKKEFLLHKNFISKIQKAMLFAKILSYEQGFATIYQASLTYQWDLSLKKIAASWRGGCIIRSQLLDDMMKSFEKNPESLIKNTYFQNLLQESVLPLRELLSTCILQGLPTPSLISALTYFDALTSSSLPANLIQAQRDFFGAHTYERIDTPRGEFFHTSWLA